MEKLLFASIKSLFVKNHKKSTMAPDYSYLATADATPVMQGLYLRVQDISHDLEKFLKDIGSHRQQVLQPSHNLNDYIEQLAGIVITDIRSHAMGKLNELDALVTKDLKRLAVGQCYATMLYAFILSMLKHENIVFDFQNNVIAHAKTFMLSKDEDTITVIQEGNKMFQQLANAEAQNVKEWMTNTSQLFNAWIQNPILKVMPDEDLKQLLTMQLKVMYDSLD